MKLTINIDMGNAAFEDMGGAAECARILDSLSEVLAYGILRPGWRHTLFDLNGNNVGEARVINSRG